MELIDEAVAAGARRDKACEELDVSLRTVQRWSHRAEDGRPGAVRAAPSNKLSDAEREQVLAIANQPEHASLAPHQIVPRLADQGVYVASESTFYRVLKAANQQHGRGRARRPSRRVVTTHRADGPNQLWCWDITWLPTTVKGQFYYWYMMKDIYSRKLVANEVHASETSELAARLLMSGCLREGVAGRPLVLHSDNGSAMKGSTMLAAIRSLRTLAPRQIVVAVPVASVEAAHAIRTEADTLVVLSVPEAFDSVGRWYADFRQTSDAEVRMLLATARDQRRPGVSEPLAAGQRSE